MTFGPNTGQQSSATVIERGATLIAQICSASPSDRHDCSPRRAAATCSRLRRRQLRACVAEKHVLFEERESNDPPTAHKRLFDPGPG